MGYLKELEEEGFPISRIADLDIAFDKLHTAIARLDCENLKRFWSKDLIQRLSEYAKAEDLRDVTPLGKEVCKL